MPRPTTQATEERLARLKAEREAKAREMVPTDRPDDPKLDRMKQAAEVLLKDRAETLKEIQEIREAYTQAAKGTKWDPAIGSYDQILWFLENLPRKKRKRKVNGEIVEEIDDTEGDEEGEDLE